MVCRERILIWKNCARASEEVIKQYPNVHPKYYELFNSEILDGVTGILLYKAYETGQLMQWFVLYGAYR